MSTRKGIITMSIEKIKEIVDDITEKLTLDDGDIHPNDFSDITHITDSSFVICGTYGEAYLVTVQEI